jgi:hypothetical protein
LGFRSLSRVSLAFSDFRRNCWIFKINKLNFRFLPIRKMLSLKLMRWL